MARRCAARRLSGGQKRKTGLCHQSGWFHLIHLIHLACLVDLDHLFYLAGWDCGVFWS